MPGGTKGIFPSNAEAFTDSERLVGKPYLGITSCWLVIGQNPDQTLRGSECYCLFTTITAEVISFTLVAEDEVALETLAAL